MNGPTSGVKVMTNRALSISNASTMPIRFEQCAKDVFKISSFRTVSSFIILLLFVRNYVCARRDLVDGASFLRIRDNTLLECGRGFGSHRVSRGDSDSQMRYTPTHTHTQDTHVEDGGNRLTIPKWNCSNFQFRKWSSCVGQFGQLECPPKSKRIRTNHWK